MGSQLAPQNCRALCQLEHPDESLLVNIATEGEVESDVKPLPVLRRANQAHDLDQLVPFESDDNDITKTTSLTRSLSLTVQPSPSHSLHARRSKYKTFDPEFLNGLLELVWPSFTEYVKEVIVNIVDSSLRAALGSLGQQIAFDGDTFDLGGKPARLTDLKISKSSHQTEVGDMDNIVMRCEVEWDANVCMNMKIASHSVGINHLSIKSQMIVEYVGMIPRPPLFQGVRIFFINAPKIDVSFQGAMTSVLNKWSNIRRKILDIVLDQVSQRFVAPNCWCVKLDPGADIFRINTPIPRGILKVSVKRAEGLLALDRPLFRAPSSDPYVAIHCGAMCFKSPIVYKTLSPTFDFDVLCPILSPHHQEFEIALYDHDIVTDDDFLGKATFFAREVMAWNKDEKEVYLQDANGNTGKNGRMWISGAWLPLHASMVNSRFHTGAYVTVGVYGVTHLPLGSADTKWWIECSCTNMMPGWQRKAVQATPKISARNTLSSKGESNSDRESEAILLTRKIRILQNCGLQIHEMATVLEIDPEKLKQLLVLLDSGANPHKKNSKKVAAKGKAADKKHHEHIDLVLSLGHHALQWEHAFDFLVQNIHMAELSFQLKSVSSVGAEVVAGALEIPANDMLGMDPATIYNYFFPGTDICLRLRLQMRSLGGAS